MTPNECTEGGGDSNSIVLVQEINNFASKNTIDVFAVAVMIAIGLSL